MKSLYFRIVWILLVVISCSVALAFILSNLFYQYYLRDITADKTVQVAYQFQDLYKQGSYKNIDTFLKDIGNLNYNVLAIDENGNVREYGQGYREKEIDPKIVKDVLNGELYNGILETEQSLLTTGFFMNTVQNSIGIQIKTQDDTYALFIRSDIEANFGELRILLGFLLMLTLVFSIALITILTSYIVKPIKKLQKATNEIAEGNFEIQLELKRKDEIGALAHDFSKMSRKLEKLDEMRKEFVSNVSHEIQSPLTSMNGFAKILHYEELTKEQAQYYAKIIEDESLRLSILSKQLLTLAQLDSNVVAMKVENINVAEQISQVIDTLEWHWSSKHQRIILHHGNVSIKGDRNLLHQVWQNILSNSIKFSNKETVISVVIASDGHFANITCSDEGEGISEESLQQVFDRFYKEDESRNRKKEGTGLGLAITKKIIEMHHGTISIESKKGIGTKVIVRIPLSKNEE